ncbi:hypothetical protein [Streptomyces sp. NPDC047043]|uniref:hypothetical protein n=1 Tax=Streptomyces sp. NPDC047043 TaxID=3154497 RepID=UPI0033E80891
MLYAVGGLALAAGALSLVRMPPNTGSGGAGTAVAEPGHDPVSGADRSDNAVATVEAVPRVSPSATSAMGGVSATPTQTAGLVPLPTTTTPPAPATPGTPTTIPEAPNTPAPATPPAPTTAAPQPAPTPSRTTEPPAPNPSQPDLCVPVVGLCVDAAMRAH